MRAYRKAVSLFGGLTFTLIACCCFLLPSRAAFAQVDEGSVTGTVTDTSGAVVPNAQVTLLNTDQGITLETRTGAAGSYTFSPVRAGHYTITVTAQGFATTTQSRTRLLPTRGPDSLRRCVAPIRRPARAPRVGLAQLALLW